MYISRFSKADQENILQQNKRALQMVDSYSSIEEKIEKYNYKFVTDNIEKIRKGQLDKIYLKTSLQTFLYLTSNDTKTKGILERILNEDIQRQVAGIYTSGRLQFLYFMTKEFQRDLADCLHVYKIIDALSIKDFEVVDKYLVSLPGPAKHGHRYSRLLCNSLYSVLKKDMNEIDKWTEAMKKFNEKSVFDKALLDALLSIIEGSFDKLQDAVIKMLINNKKKYRENGAIQYVCIPAHAIINLAEHFHGSISLGFVEELDNLYWDKEFYHGIRNKMDNSFSDFCSFKQLNPVLQNWISNLPLDIKLEDMIDL